MRFAQPRFGTAVLALVLFGLLVVGFRWWRNSRHNAPSAIADETNRRASFKKREVVSIPLAPEPFPNLAPSLKAVSSPEGARSILADVRSRLGSMPREECSKMIR